MALLAFGVVLFAGLHLLKSLAPSLRANMLKRFGENGYKGVFSLLVLAAIVLMVIGWRGAVPQLVYLPPASLHGLALTLLIVAFWLLVVSARPARVRRLVRHPQLTGVALWGIAHLLLNGDSRSLLLFGGMLAWAVAEIIFISQREGDWVKPGAPPLATDLVNLLITAVVLVVIVFAHPWLSGVPTGLLPY